MLYLYYTQAGNWIRSEKIIRVVVSSNVAAADEVPFSQYHLLTCALPPPPRGEI